MWLLFKSLQKNRKNESNDENTERGVKRIDNKMIGVTIKRIIEDNWERKYLINKDKHK